MDRNPITGVFTLNGVEPEFDFWFVNLYDRPFVCDIPTTLERDSYIYKVTTLNTHTWCYHQLIKQLEAARNGTPNLNHVTFTDEKVVQTTSRWDCAKIALEMPMTTQRPYYLLVLY